MYRAPDYGHELDQIVVDLPYVDLVRHYLSRKLHPAVASEPPVATIRSLDLPKRQRHGNG
jgi:hypothetical protein